MERADEPNGQHRHWRTDGHEALRVGEAVAIGIMADERLTFNERFAGFSLTTFDGTTVTV